MSTLHSFKKRVTVNPDLHFDLDMYTNVVGSLIITAYMMTEIDKRPEMTTIKKQWKTIKKKGLSKWLDDPDFIEETLKLFNLEPPYGYFAMVQSDLNVLFMPYVDEELLPLREDGVMPHTASCGKIYPIVKKED